MRKITILVTAFLLSFSMFAQQPQGGVGRSFPQGQRPQGGNFGARTVELPSGESFQTKELTFTSNGKKIYGVACIPNAGGKKPAVIMSHGYGGSSSAFYSQMNDLASQGYICYAIDFSGGGRASKSEGDTREMSIFTEKQNLLDAIDFVRSWDNVDTDNIFLLGESQGGHVSAIAAAAVPEKIKAIALIYPAFCIHDDAHKLYATKADIPDEVNFMGMPVGKVYYEAVYDYDVYSVIPGFQKDVLIVHGDNDRLVNISYSEKAVPLYKSCEYHVIPGGGHGFRGEQLTTKNNYVYAFLKAHTSTTQEPVAQEIDSVPTVSAKWELSRTMATSSSESWINGNVLYSNLGSQNGVAYISTSAGNKSSEPERSVVRNSFGVGNLSTGDALVFTMPNTTLAKGSTVDFMTVVYASDTNVPKYWIFEYLEDGKWKSVSDDLHIAAEDKSVKYSFYVRNQKNNHYTVFSQTFKLAKALKNENLVIRCRVVGNVNNADGQLVATPGSCLCIANSTWASCYINAFENIPIKDTKKILILGNSYTYYYGTNFLLKEIARSQGHELIMRTSLNGGLTFRNHLDLELSQNAVNDGNYDFAILQDQSSQHARYYKDPEGKASIMADTKELVSKIKEKSPKVTVMIENTWACAAGNYDGYGNYEDFDKALYNGSCMITSEIGTWMSPIGVAFQQARNEGVAELYGPDHKHPNRNGAYLKACVNYLMLYGGTFDQNVPSCGVDKSVAEKLRSIAQRVVSENTKIYHHPDTISL